MTMRLCNGESSSEIMPEWQSDERTVVGTGRSDFPNQVNNVHATQINEEMKMACTGYC